MRLAQERCRKGKPLPTDDCAAVRAALRYFLDTEYNGIGGALLSLALVPDDGDELYLTLKTDEPLARVGAAACRALSRHGARAALLPAADAATMRRDALERYLRHDEEPLIVADWPEDIAQFCNLMITGPGDMVELRNVTFRLGADEQLQHRGEQQGAAQCAARRAGAARPHPRDGIDAIRRRSGRLRLSGASSRSIQVSSLSCKLAARHAPARKSSAPASVAASASTMLHLAVAPFLAPLAQRKDDGQQPLALGRQRIDHASLVGRVGRPLAESLRRPASTAGPRGCCARFPGPPGTPRNAEAR